MYVKPKGACGVTPGRPGLHVLYFGPGRPGHQRIWVDPVQNVPKGVVSARKKIPAGCQLVTKSLKGAFFAGNKKPAGCTLVTKMLYFQISAISFSRMHFLWGFRAEGAAPGSPKAYIGHGLAMAGPGPGPYGPGPIWAHMGLGPYFAI